MIDITKSVFFYDDRSKIDCLMEMDVVLFRDDKFVLCTVKEGAWEDEDAAPLLFRLTNGEVLNSVYDSWTASNDDEFIQELRAQFAERELEQKEFLVDCIEKLVPPLNDDGNKRSRPLMMAMSVSELQAMYDALNEVVESSRMILRKLSPEKQNEFIRLLSDTEASKQALAKLDEMRAK